MGSGVAIAAGVLQVPHAHAGRNWQELQPFDPVSGIARGVRCALHEGPLLQIATRGTQTMRIVLLLTSLLFAACTVGEVGTSNNTGADGGGSGSNMANACVNRITPPDAPHLHTAGGTSNKGLNCIVAGCHLNNNPGAGAPGYQFAGTVYVAGQPGVPNAGATVRIKVGTNVMAVITDADGNFSFPAGAAQGNFTATTDATACPTVTPMIGPLVGGGGAGANSCNLCHTTAAGAQAPPITL